MKRTRSRSPGLQHPVVPLHLRRESLEEFGIRPTPGRRQSLHPRSVLRLRREIRVSHEFEPPCFFKRAPRGVPEAPRGDLSAQERQHHLGLISGTKTRRNAQRVSIRIVAVTLTRRTGSASGCAWRTRHTREARDAAVPLQRRRDGDTQGPATRRRSPPPGSCAMLMRILSKS